MATNTQPGWPVHGKESGGLDQEALFGIYTRSEDRKARLNDRVLHKAFNIPLPEDVNVDQRKYGVGAGGLLALALGLGIPGAAVLGGATWLAGKYMDSQKQSAQAPPTSTVKPLTQKLRVVVDGEEITVVPVESTSEGATPP